MANIVSKALYVVSIVLSGGIVALFLGSARNSEHGVSASFLKYSLVSISCYLSAFIICVVKKTRWIQVPIIGSILTHIILVLIPDIMYARSYLPFGLADEVKEIIIRTVVQFVMFTAISFPSVAIAHFINKLILKHSMR
jgi:hypothetical protein